MKTAGSARLTGFIFDFDGVLVDSNQLHVEAWECALQQHGHHVPRASIFQEIGKGGDKLVVSLLGQTTEDRQGNGLRAAHGSHYARLVESRGLRPFENGAALIADLRRRDVRTALASSSSSDDLGLAERASGTAWRGLFDAVVLADDVDETKPAPDLVSTAAKKIGRAPDACGMLGDTPWDIQAARSAGALPIAVTSGGHTAEALQAAGARVIFRDVADVLLHLDEILSAPAGAR